MQVFPASAVALVQRGAAPHLVAKLVNIEYMDLAEQVKLLLLFVRHGAKPEPSSLLPAVHQPYSNGIYLFTFPVYGMH